MRPSADGPLEDTHVLVRRDPNGGELWAPITPAPAPPASDRRERLLADDCDDCGESMVSSHRCDPASSGYQRIRERRREEARAWLADHPSGGRDDST